MAFHGMADFQITQLFQRFHAQSAIFLRQRGTIVLDGTGPVAQISINGRQPGAHCAMGKIAGPAGGFDLRQALAGLLLLGLAQIGLDAGVQLFQIAQRLAHMAVVQGWGIRVAVVSCSCTSW